MKLFVLVLCLVLQRYYTAAVLSDSYDLVGAYWRKMQSLIAHQVQWNGWVALVVMVLPACFVLSFINAFLSSSMLFLGLINFIFHVVVILFCLTTPIRATALEACASALDHGDVAAASGVMGRLFGMTFPTTKAEFLVALEEMLLKRSLYDLFAIMFWYLWFGLSGAVGMRLVLHALQEREHGADTLAEKVVVTTERACYYLVWPVLRCWGITLALVGHFSKVLQIWLKTVFTRVPHDPLLLQLAAAALATNRLEDCDTTHDQQLVINLIDYSTVIWLIVVALIRVGGWLL